MIFYWSGGETMEYVINTEVWHSAIMDLHNANVEDNVPDEPDITRLLDIVKLGSEEIKHSDLPIITMLSAYLSEGEREQLKKFISGKFN